MGNDVVKFPSQMESVRKNRETIETTERLNAEIKKESRRLQELDLENKILENEIEGRMERINYYNEISQKLMNDLITLKSQQEKMDDRLQQWNMGKEEFKKITDNLSKPKTVAKTIPSEATSDNIKKLEETRKSLGKQIEENTKLISEKLNNLSK